MGGGGAVFTKKCETITQKLNIVLTKRIIVTISWVHRKFAFTKLSHWAQTQLNANFIYEFSNSVITPP